MPQTSSTVNVVALTYVVEPTVRPVPEIDTVELAVKFVPVIVTVVCDFGERYISTVLYEDIRG